MRFLTRLRGQSADREFNRDDIVWGVRRRAGFGDLDDPRAHAGRVKHAFMVGDDRAALCGYRPLRWRRRAPMPLAVATDYNEPCRRCLAVIPRASQSDLESLGHAAIRLASEIFPSESPSAVPVAAAAAPAVAALPSARVSTQKRRRLRKAPQRRVMGLSASP